MKLMKIMRCFLALILTSQAAFALQVVQPGGVWLDNRGQQIQAHGGVVMKWQSTFYWFGEDRSQTNEPGKRYVACYASKDFVHWTFRRQVVAWSDVRGLGTGWILERPKIFYNAKTRKFLLYAHIDDVKYKTAEVAVGVSDRIDGDYQYVKSFRPLGKESRDIGEFVDDDGSAYLIFESRPSKGFYVSRLSDDFLNVDQETSFVDAPLEGGALAHVGGLYYVVGSHLTGWSPNPNVYATSETLAGPWTKFEDIAPPEAVTYGSQSSALLKITGSKGSSVIFMGDIWKPKTLWDSRYFWMPVVIDGKRMSLPKPCPWHINIKLGEASCIREEAAGQQQ